MYTPRHFSVPEKETLQQILPEASFALFVTPDADGIPQATHLPVSYDPDKGRNGTIYAHMAKANDHWQLFDGNPTLVVFSGPHTYVSPRFYDTTINVPTWNYVAVHAYGQPKILNEAADVLGVLKTLSAENEQGRNDPWDVSEVPENKLHALMNVIVAFEIPIERLEAKAKLGQNKKAEDKAALSAALSKTEIARWQKSIL
jgi:transcriptional regulator